MHTHLIRLAAAVLTAAATAAVLALTWPSAPASPPPPPPPSTVVVPSFGGTDAAWLQLMIPMDESLLTLLPMVATHTDHPALRAIAADLDASHRAELDQLRALRAARGLAPTTEHEGHDLPGIVVPADLAAHDAARGPAFDTLFLATLREHLEQGARLAVAVRQHGHDEAVREISVRLEASRTAFLARLPPG